MMPDYTTPPLEWTVDLWREAMKAVVQLGVLPDEDVDDVVTAGWVLGQKRAELRGDPFWPGVHPQYPLMALTWWPWKTAYGAEARSLIFEKRSQLVKGLDGYLREHIHGLMYAIPDNENMQRLMGVIPDHILALPIDDLYQRIARDEGVTVTKLLRW